MDFTLPATAASLRETADAFVERALLPHAHLLPPAEGPLPPAVVRACAAERRATGLWGLTVPAGVGGPGLSSVERAVVQERLHRSLLGLWPQGLFSLGEPPTPLYGAQGPQRAQYLEPCLDGRRQAHQWVATPEGPRASPTPGGVRLQGTALAVPAFLAQDLLIVVAQLQGQACGFLCEPGLPGYGVVRRRPGMGSVELVDLAFEDCRLEADRLLPDAGPAAERWRADLRATVLGAGAIGAAERCLEMGLQHIRARETFGRPLADRQAIQWMLADSARELHAARLLVYRAASLADLGEAAEAARLAGPAKALATAAACRVVDRVIQMHGGYGYSRDLPLERFWRDLRFYRLAEGTEAALCADGAAALVADLDR